MHLDEKHHKNMNHSKAFTLLELIIVIIIVGILAVVGLTTYTNQIEYSRVSEAKANISAMRKLTYEYYLKNGTLSTIQISDLGVNSACTSSAFFRYAIDYIGTAGNWVKLAGIRCTSGGKSPDADRGYHYYLDYYPSTGSSVWHCYYSDDSTVGCFGLTRDW